VYRDLTSDMQRMGTLELRGADRPAEKNSPIKYRNGSIRDMNSAIEA